MTKIFFDSNIWLRYFLRDNEQYETAEKVLKLVDEGNFLLYTSSIVILEVIFVLTRTYKRTFEEVFPCIKALLEIRNITLVEKTDTPLALEYYERTKVKFSDCLIASQIPEETILATFDKDFSKIREVGAKTPAEILAKES